MRLLADAGCLSDEQLAEAVELVTAYTITLQTELQQVGLYDGAIDGIYGPQTVAAVKQLQADSGLPETGFVDRATAVALDALLAELGLQTAAAEMTHTASVQTVLTLTGYWTGPIDGDVDRRADRRAAGVPDRARRRAHRRGRRRHAGRLRTGPRQSRHHTGHDRPPDGPTGDRPPATTLPLPLLNRVERRPSPSPTPRSARSSPPPTA